MTRQFVKRPNWQSKDACVIDEVAQRHAYIYPSSSWAAGVSGGWTLEPESSGDYGGGGYAYITTPAIGSYVEYDIGILMAGTWQQTLFGSTWPDRGIVALSINGTQVGTMDRYTAASDQLGALGVVNFTIATARRVIARYTVTGKNGASSGYGFYMHLATFDRTGA